MNIDENSWFYSSAECCREINVVLLNEHYAHGTDVNWMGQGFTCNCISHLCGAFIDECRVQLLNCQYRLETCVFVNRFLVETCRTGCIKIFWHWWPASMSRLFLWMVIDHARKSINDRYALAVVGMKIRVLEGILHFEIKI